MCSRDTAMSVRMMSLVVPRPITVRCAVKTELAPAVVAAGHQQSPGVRPAVMRAQHPGAHRGGHARQLVVARWRRPRGGRVGHDVPALGSGLGNRPRSPVVALCSRRRPALVLDHRLLRPHVGWIGQCLEPRPCREVEPVTRGASRRGHPFKFTCQVASLQHGTEGRGPPACQGRTGPDISAPCPTSRGSVRRARSYVSG